MMTAATGELRLRHHARWRVRLAVLLALVTVGTATAVPAWADRAPSAERQLAQLINAERSSRGLPPLSVADDIAGVAHQWSASMARTGQLSHNPSFGTEICCWVTVAENVASAGPINSWPNLDAAMRDVHIELMASSDHRANILDPAHREIGVGVVVVGDVAWITQNFRQPDAPDHTGDPADDQTTPDDPGASAEPGGQPDAPQPDDDATPGTVLLEAASQRLGSASGIGGQTRSHPVYALVSHRASSDAPDLAALLDRIDQRVDEHDALAAARHPVWGLLESVAAIED